MTLAAPASPDRPGDAPAGKSDERRALGVASGAHVLHDGYTDLIVIMLPIWQAEFGIGYAALGMLRTCYSGTMAALQIPAALLAERLGMAPVLAAGTALAGVAYLAAGVSTGFWTLVVALVLGGIGSSTQHPLASALVARAYAGPRSMKALGTYNFAGDIGKMSIPAGASLLLVILPWQPTLAIVGTLGLAVAAAILLLAPRFAPEPKSDLGGDAATTSEGGIGRRGRFGFPLLLAIGMVDSATRMGFLVFLPFVLIAKGASLPTVGLALTLVFAGGAAGKLICGFIGARFGVIATVCFTEGLTVIGIIALLPLPLEAALIVLPVIGVMLNGTSSVLYGSVPELVEREKRTQAFSVFYTGTIGAGALAPVAYGLIGDFIGVPAALTVVASVCLATVPLALALRPALPAHAR